MSEVVRVDVAERVATVSLNRPDKLNAVSPEVFEGLYEAGRRVEADDEVRAVVLRGEGRAFCSGLDLASLQAFGSGNVGNTGNGERSQDSSPGRAQGGFAIWHTMPKPVVAAVQGYALGAGFQLALAADIRIAAEGAVMSVFEITYGLVPDLGGTQLLPRIVGPARAKELIWTAHRITTDEALAWGIVNRVVAGETLEAEARALALDLASRPPLPIGFAKALVDKAGRVSLEEGMRGEIEAQIRCLTSNDMREAVAAAFEKRPGSYTGT
jgi:enoyl-CoA hydratase/carnithine racemase